jgi:hypothetical protein
MIMILACLIMSAVSGVIMVNGFYLPGLLGMLISAIFALGQLSNSSEEDIF